jgi:hypothetical protein
MLGSRTPVAGAKLIIHDSALPPLLEEYAIDLQPNTATSVAVQVVRIQKVKKRFKVVSAKRTKSSKLK